MKRISVLLITMVLLLLGCHAAPHTFSDTDTENSVASSTRITSDTSRTTEQAAANVLSITLYRKENMFTDEAEKVETLDDVAQIESICKQLSNASWQSHTESSWVKCQPKFASYILVFAQENGEQTVLHIPYADNGYIAVGTFENNLTYAEIFDAADADQKKGVERFTRYTVNKALIADLCALF